MNASDVSSQAEWVAKNGSWRGQSWWLVEGIHAATGGEPQIHPLTFSNLL